MKNRQAPFGITFLLLVSGGLVGCSGGADPGTTGTAGRGGTTGSSGSSGGGQSGTTGGGGMAGTSAGGGQGGTAGAGNAGSGGTSSGGSSGSSGSSGSAGTGVAGAAGGGSGSGGRGGSAGTGGASGGAGASGRGGSAGGSAGAGGTGGSVARWTCPSGPFTAPTPSQVTLTKVTGVPPFDSFNNNGNNFGNIEGACWFSDALYVSEIGSTPNPPPSRILRTTGTVGIAFPDSGTNGLAIDTMGRLIGASHKVGGIVAFNLTNMTSTTIVSAYMGNRFNSPNDLTVRSDGTIYFTDPDYQAPSSRPQAMNRVYRVPPGSTTPTVVDAGRSQPNGITLSLDESTLYVADSQGLWKYAVATDGTTGAATRIAQSAVSTGDGMGIDCAGNLYVASNQQVVVVNPAGSGTSLGTIALTGVQSVTNIAFGGANHQTLYVTGLGNGMGGSAMGLYRADMPLPGMPF